MNLIINCIDGNCIIDKGCLENAGEEINYECPVDFHISFSHNDRIDITVVMDAENIGNDHSAFVSGFVNIQDARILHKALGEYLETIKK